MKRGSTTRGRQRAQRERLTKATAQPLLRGLDHGPPIVVRSEHVGAGKRNERWVEPFLDANRPQLTRLELRPEVSYEGELLVRLRPGSRIGAAALLAPTTRKVAAGVLVEPRFHWSALGDVVGRVGFAVEPQVGGGRLVPGSAREVPAWLLAGPVLSRLAAILRRRKRSFVLREETRTMPRGRVDWTRYAQRSVATGRLHHLPCRFSEPDDDPRLMASVRWTLDRMTDSLASLAPTPLGRALLDTAGELLVEVGPGPRRRPDPLDGDRVFGGELFVRALEAMSWVAEERGLGGARTLDGMPWDLAIDQLWERWVARVMEELAPRLGFGVRSGDQTEHVLRWRGSLRSMRSLRPDVELVAQDRVVWIDAKYKHHLRSLARSEWTALDQQTRDSHRADLHQALAYASLSGLSQVDTVLAYPVAADRESGSPVAVATVTSGARRVRLFLVGLPFGFRSKSHEESLFADWRALLHTA